MIEHHIQRDILLRLMQAKTLRFSDLKPEGMESNSFMYHLRQLMNGGYVVQLDDKTYTLSPTGLSYIDSLSLANTLPRKQPKLACIIALKNSDGKYLFAKRLMQPTIDTWMLPSGKQHFGESSQEHVKRETLQQFETEVATRYRGVLDVRIRHGDTIVTHLVGQVYSSEYNDEAPVDSPKFHYEWRGRDDKIALTPGTSELIDALEAHDEPFFLSLDVTAD